MSIYRTIGPLVMIEQNKFQSECKLSMKKFPNLRARLPNMLPHFRVSYRVMRKRTMWFLNRSDTNRAVQAQKMAKGCKF